MSLFTMMVRDTFHLGNGRTVFVGPLEKHLKYIPPCDCEIVVNDEVRGTVRIDGEDFLKDKGIPDRAISTSQRVDLTRWGIGTGGFTIRSKD